MNSSAPIPAYELDPRCRELTTAVLDRGIEDGRPYVIPADTPLYPEGGGQPADHGRLLGIEVVELRKTAAGIRHYLAEPLSPTIERVTISLDWERRFDHMQQHTGQHLLTALAQDRFGWPTTAFHLGDQRSDIELDTPALSPRQIAALEEEVAAEIRAARPVTAKRVAMVEFETLTVRTRGLPDGHSGPVRLVEIAGIDINTCGGTHLQNTAELEALKLLGTESMRGGTRLFFVAGARLRRLLGSHEERNAALRRILGGADAELPGLAQARIDQLKELQRQLRTAEENLAQAWVAEWAQAPGIIVGKRLPGRDNAALSLLAKQIQTAAPHKVALLAGGEEEEGPFLLVAGETVTIDVAAVGRELAALLGGRGGGSGRIFQGKAGALSRFDEALRRLAALVN